MSNVVCELRPLIHTSFILKKKIINKKIRRHIGLKFHSINKSRPFDAYVVFGMNFDLIV